MHGWKNVDRAVYISSLPADTERLLRVVRAHWSVENRLYWSVDVVFADDQMRARTGRATHHFTILKHITLNLIRLVPVKRKGGIEARRLMAANSDKCSEHLLGLA